MVAEAVGCGGVVGKDSDSVLPFVRVEATLPANVEYGADRAATASPLRGRAFEVSRLSVFRPHAAVEEGSDDR